MKDLKMNEVAKALLAAGFKVSFVTYQLEITINDNTYMIVLDPAKPNRIKTLRVSTPDSISVRGLIGNFIGGKGEMKRFSFNSPEQLIKKLGEIKL